MSKSSAKVSETIVFHPKEWILWFVLYMIALTTVRVMVPPALTDRQQAMATGSNWDEISGNVLQRCRNDLNLSCLYPQYRSVPRKSSVLPLNTQLCRSINDEGLLSSASTVGSSNPALGILRASQRCPVNHAVVTEEHENQPEQIETIQQLFLLSLETLFEEFWRMHRRYSDDIRVQANEVFWKSLLDALETNKYENEKLVLWNTSTTRTIPVGKFSRDKLIQLLITAIENFRETRSGRTDAAGPFIQQMLNFQLQNANKHTQPSSSLMAKELGQSTLPLLPFFSSIRHSDGSIMCLQSLYNQDYLISKQCQVALEVGMKRSKELEIYWDVPIASLLCWFYILFGIVMLVALGADLGQLETPKQRKQRQFRQMLQDPLLRRRIELDARTEFGDNHAKVAEFMTGLDVKAQVMEEAYVDEEWKKKEAIRMAWKARVRYLWGLRKLLVLLLGLSCCLLYLDRPKANVVMRGGLVLAMVMVGTYFSLPKPPEEQAKKSLEAAEPLLKRGTPAHLV